VGKAYRQKQPKTLVRMVGRPRRRQPDRATPLWQQYAIPPARPTEPLPMQNTVLRE
jgi:hypothetical protein